MPVTIKLPNLSPTLKMQMVSPPPPAPQAAPFKIICFALKMHQRSYVHKYWPLLCHVPVHISKNACYVCKNTTSIIFLGTVLLVCSKASVFAVHSSIFKCLHSGLHFRLCACLKKTMIILDCSSVDDRHK